MMINECKLSALDQFDPTKVVKQDVTRGEGFRSYVLNMLPGQEVPAHSHNNTCVVLFPQSGKGLLFTDDAEEIILEAGCIYTDLRGRNFGLRNTGGTPFQVLVTLISTCTA